MQCQGHLGVLHNWIFISGFGLRPIEIVATIQDSKSLKAGATVTIDSLPEDVARKGGKPCSARTVLWPCGERSVGLEDGGVSGLGLSAGPRHDPPRGSPGVLAFL